MSKAFPNVELLPEPELEFASRQQIEHPVSGLGLFGPVDSNGIEKPNRINYAVIGRPDGIVEFSAFAARLNSPIDPPPERSEILWPHYPGFEEAMHAVFPKSAPLSEPLDSREIGVQLIKAMTTRECSMLQVCISTQSRRSHERTPPLT